MAYGKKIRELSVTDKIGLAAVAVLGRDYAEAAYKTTHNIKTENAASVGVMVSRWLGTDKAKAFLHDIRQQYANILLDNIDGDSQGLTESQLIRIVEKGIVSEKDPKKQADVSLKLMQWKKDARESEPEEERRKYVLPWLSKCRYCQLMKTYLEIHENAKK